MEDRRYLPSYVANELEFALIMKDLHVEADTFDDVHVIYIADISAQARTLNERAKEHAANILRELDINFDEYKVQDVTADWLRDDDALVRRIEIVFKLVKTENA